MTSATKTLPSIQNWDLIITNGGVAILVVPDVLDAGALVACPDGAIVVGRSGCVHLAQSEDATGFLRRKKNVLIAAVGSGQVRERIVPVRIVSHRINAGAPHAAAA